MLNQVRRLGKYLPTLVLSCILSVAVWISAVSASDPVEERLYNRPVAIEIVGQDSSMVLSSEVPEQVSIRLRAPRSVWESLLNQANPVKAFLDLSNLDSGPHTEAIKIQVALRPVEVVSFSPADVDLVLEPLVNRMVPIRLIEKGEPSIGFQADKAVLEKEEALVSGPESQVKLVSEILAEVDINQARENIDNMVTLEPVDAELQAVEGVTLNPEQINVTQDITQRGGYRNVIVKVVVSGQIANGNRVTNISAFPPVVTIYSSNPQTIENLPGYVETAPLNLTGARDDIDIETTLNLPAGVSVVGDQTVNVQVGIAAIESSVTLPNMEVEVINMPKGLIANISPQVVDVIISGPMPLLDALNAADVQIVLDLADAKAGTYQLTPKASLKISELRVESIVPGTIEVNLTAGTPAR
ncbi:MAG: YbbR-like domain-containing protein [Anaerolineaceae bacterium]